MFKLAWVVGALLLLPGFVRADGPASQPAAASEPSGVVNSRTAEKDGLATTVTLPQARFAEDEVIKFTVTFKNVSDKAVLLHDAAWFRGWQIGFTEAGTQNTWRVEFLEDIERKIPADTLLKPGETLQAPVVLGGAHQFVCVRERLEPMKRDRLEPGSYELCIYAIFKKGEAKSEAGYWTGQVVSKPVQLTIAGKPREDKGPAEEATSKPVEKDGAQTRPATRGGEAGVVVADVVADGSAAIRRATPKGWSVLRVEKNRDPYKGEGTGTAVYLVSERHAPGSKVEHDAVVYIMPADYDDGGVDPNSGQFQTRQAELVGKTPAGKVYLWTNGMGGWKKIQEDVLEALGKPAGGLAGERGGS